MTILMYLVIFVLKIVEVSIGINCVALITRGEKLLASFLGFFEVIIWIILAVTVLKDITSDPMKTAAYAAGFALGNYLGLVVDQKLGIGNIRMEVIVMKEHGFALVNELRNEGYAVTVIDGKGMNCDRQILILNTRRKNYENLVEKIREYQENVVITISNNRPVYGGYGILK